MSLLEAAKADFENLSRSVHALGPLTFDNFRLQWLELKLPYLHLAVVDVSERAKVGLMKHALLKNM